MQEKIEKYVQEYEKKAERLAREYKIIKMLSWISLFLILAVLILFIVKSSFAACPSGQVQDYQGNCVSINQAASEVNNPYSNSGGSSLSGLMSYGQNNISLTPSGCANSTNFLNVEYSVTSSGDINAIIQMNTNNGSGYNSSYSIPVLISGVCSNGFISCPAGEWYGGGITCNNYAIQYSPSAGFSLESLGAAIIGTPQSTSVNVPLNGTQVSTVTSTQTSGGLADCIDINDATGTTPASETEVQQVLTDLGGQITSAIQSGSSDIIGGVSQNTASSPYSATYSGGTCNSSNYNPPSNLEGLYNQGGSSLNNEVSSSQVATANSNTQSALGLTSTPTSMLMTIQNNSFGGMGGGSCSIENQVSFMQSITYTYNAYFNKISLGGGAIGVASGGDQACANSACWPTSPTTINLATNDYGSHCSPVEVTGITLSGSTISGSGACSGSLTLSSTGGINPGGQINCDTSNDDGCSQTGWTSFTGGGNTITVSGAISGTITIQPSYQYYPVYSQPVNSCSTYINNSNCSLISEQACDNTDSNCVSTLSNSNPVGTPPDFVWTYGQTDDNQPVSTITWTINMNGTSVQVTPSETTDTINYGTLATTSSTAGGGNDYPYINETYECSGTSPYNFTAMNEQQTAVTCQPGQKCQACPTCPVVTGTASTNSNNTAFSYTGVNGNQHNNISINNTVNDATQQECVVQQTTTNTSVTSSVTATTATQNTPTSNTTTNTETLNCANTGTVNNPVWNCPVPSGYTIQTDCTDASNINNANFAPAMVEIQVLDKAGSSLICSAN